MNPFVTWISNCCFQSFFNSEIKLQNHTSDQEDSRPTDFRFSLKEFFEFFLVESQPTILNFLQATADPIFRVKNMLEPELLDNFLLYNRFDISIFFDCTIYDTN